MRGGLPSGPPPPPPPPGWLHKPCSDFCSHSHPRSATPTHLRAKGADWQATALPPMPRSHQPTVQWRPRPLPSRGAAWVGGTRRSLFQHARWEDGMSRPHWLTMDKNIASLAMN